MQLYSQTIYLNVVKNMKIYTKIKSLIKSFFNQLYHPSIYGPITRKEVLEYAKHNKHQALCITIILALFHYGIYISTSEIDLLFPLFSRKNAFRFGASPFKPFWWPRGEWNTGRKDFLDWLIEKYKNDKTNLIEEVQRLRL